MQDSSRPSKRRRTYTEPSRATSGGTSSTETKTSPLARRLSSLPLDVWGVVGGFTGYDPSHSSVSQSWGRQEGHGCSTRTKNGARCLHERQRGQLELVEGCRQYCLGRDPCPAWLEAVLTNFRQVAEVEWPVKGKARLLLQPRQYLVEADTGLGLRLMALASPTSQGWTVTEMKRQQATRVTSESSRQTALVLCDFLRQNEVEHLFLRMRLRTIDHIPTTTESARPILHSKADNFSPAFLPPRWFRNLSEEDEGDEEEEGLSALIDLRDRLTRECEETTNDGSSCLAELTNPEGKCSAYCLRQGNCRVWASALFANFQRLPRVAWTNEQDGPGAPVTVTVKPKLQVLDAKGQEIFQMTRTNEGDWFTEGDDGLREFVPGMSSPYDIASRLCRQLASGRAQDLRVTLQPLSDRLAPAVAAGSSFQLQWYGQPNPSSDKLGLQWHLVVGDDSATSSEWRLEATVSLRTRTQPE